ncbi:hypothetical protein B0J11DRAFT_512839 [Dendryphion nanum]|uniref:Uncharacterized protein n=1 Tax=Dendryphion nanum TaxID=256645 RepID=A0A9P9I7G5_9PLEO|nr:hypothetical protein B0J11DRAFT_512839 [Dendryphion nanum]
MCNGIPCSRCCMTTPARRTQAQQVNVPLRPISQYSQYHHGPAQGVAVAAMSTPQANGSGRSSMDRPITAQQYQSHQMPTFPQQNLTDQNSQGGYAAGGIPNDPGYISLEKMKAALAQVAAKVESSGRTHHIMAQGWSSLFLWGGLTREDKDALNKFTGGKVRNYDLAQRFEYVDIIPNPASYNIVAVSAIEVQKYDRQLPKEWFKEHAQTPSTTELAALLFSQSQKSYILAPQNEQGLGLYIHKEPLDFMLAQRLERLANNGYSDKSKQRVDLADICACLRVYMRYTTGPGPLQLGPMNTETVLKLCARYAGLAGIAFSDQDGYAIYQVNVAYADIFGVSKVLGNQTDLAKPLTIQSYPQGAIDHRAATPGNAHKANPYSSQPPPSG